MRLPVNLRELIATHDIFVAINYVGLPPIGPPWFPIQSRGKEVSGLNVIGVGTLRALAGPLARRSITERSIIARKCAPKLMAKLHDKDATCIAHQYRVQLPERFAWPSDEKEQPNIRGKRAGA